METQLIRAGVNRGRLKGEGELGRLISIQLESELELVQGCLAASVLLFAIFFLLSWLSLWDGGSSWASYLMALPLERKEVSS